MSKIKVLLVKPSCKPVAIEIDDGLKSLQNAVGGYIEAVYPFEDPVAIICNEEGKLIPLTPNRALYDDNGKMYDIICGDFLVVGLTEDNFGSLSNELIAKYTELFRW